MIAWSRSGHGDGSNGASGGNITCQVPVESKQKKGIKAKANCGTPFLHLTEISRIRLTGFLDADKRCH